MLEQCDIRGLTLILNDIGAREFILHQASGGVIFLMIAIEFAHPQSVQFLLEHNLTQKDNKDIYEEQMIYRGTHSASTRHPKTPRIQS